MREIRSQKQLKELALWLNVRKDWHEPDEQEVTVEVKGSSFDNAGFWPAAVVVPGSKPLLEKHVIIKKDGKPVAAVNLASLFAMACGNPMED